MTTININAQKCTLCTNCVRVCPSAIFALDKTDKQIITEYTDQCIVCGHCVAVCPTEAIDHQDFPASTVHPFDASGLPSADQVELLIKTRRSNRVFSKRPIDTASLNRIVEAGYRAPTASNLQQEGFTIITSPEKLKEVSDFCIETFASLLRKMENPILGPILKKLMPSGYRYLPVFRRMIDKYRQGYDPILRGATALLLIHTPAKSRFGVADSNLAYQNASLMAESLRVGQFYTGFVLTCAHQRPKDFAQLVNIPARRLDAGMAMGVPAISYLRYIDRKPINLNKINS